MARRSATPPTETGGGSGDDVFQAKLLTSALQPMVEGKPMRVLDLGPAQSATVAFFTGSRCRLGIADLATELPVLDAEEDKLLRKQLLLAALPAELFRESDLVLCWDFFNYLRPPAIATLMAQVGELLAPGALVHALVAYGAAMMPDPPPPFSLQPDPGWIKRAGTSATAVSRPAPRYATGELLKVMPGYAVERSTLMRNGTQEYLFKH